MLVALFVIGECNKAIEKACFWMHMMEQL